VQPQNPWTAHAQDPWDHALVNHTGSAGIPSNDKKNLNLATLVMHGDEAYLKQEWIWEMLNKGIGISYNNTNIHHILSLQATLGKEVKIGCWAVNGSTHGKPMEIKTYYTNFSKTGNNGKSASNIPETDC